MIKQFLTNQHTPKILIVGDLMIDHYVWGICERISPEAPVAVVEVSKESRRLGGACNVMHNLLALNAYVIPCGVIGADKVGQEIKSKLEEFNMSLEGIFMQHDRLSTQKTRIIASHQQVVRVDWEHKDDIDAQIEHMIECFCAKTIADVDIVILSDYGKGVLTAYLTQKIIALSRQANKPILIDPKGNDYTKYRHATILTPNKKEIYEATGIKIIDDSTLKKALITLQEVYHITYPLITLSEDGIGILQADSLYKIPTTAKEVYDVTGAGDTVIASLAFALSFEAHIIKAAQFANAAAAVVVSKIGSATASLEEIRDCFFDTTIQKIITQEYLPFLAQTLRYKQKKIIWTNGCFDILHLGHVRYLQESKKLGDVLIVGVNSDDSIKQLKGDKRPINTLEERMGVLSALESIDYIVPFDELTPYNLIKVLSPHVIVKGGDYAHDEIIGREFAQEVHIIPLVAGKSTTNLIETLKKL